MKGRIRGARFFAENDQYIFFLSEHRYLGLFKYNKETKNGEVITKMQCPGYGADEEYSQSLDIDSRNKVVMVTHYRIVNGKPR